MATKSEEERIACLQKRAEETEKMVSQLRQCLEALKRKTVEKSRTDPAKEETKQLEAENVRLRKEIDELRKVLVDLEARNGLIQIPLPTSSTPAARPPTQPVVEQDQPVLAKEPVQPPQECKQKKERKESDSKEKPKAVKSPPPQGNAPRPVDVSRLDFRVGKIVQCEKHPDADTLYLEKIDMGEEAPRTVVSGLVNDVPLDQMQNRMVVVICNLKPAKMRGVLSEAMVMCACSPTEKSEIIDPPEGSMVGERITFEGFDGTPDGQLNPKRKIFEQLKPDLFTTAECVATYKGIPFTVPGKGTCTVGSMKNSGIK